MRRGGRKKKPVQRFVAGHNYRPVQVVEVSDSDEEIEDDNDGSHDAGTPEQRPLRGILRVAGETYRRKRVTFGGLPESETDSEIYSDSDLESDSESDLESDSESDAEADAEVDAEAGAEIDADAGAVSDSETNEDSGENVNAGTSGNHDHGDRRKRANVEEEQADNNKKLKPTPPPSAVATDSESDENSAGDHDPSNADEETPHYSQQQVTVENLPSTSTSASTSRTVEKPSTSHAARMALNLENLPSTSKASSMAQQSSATVNDQVPGVDTPRSSIPLGFPGNPNPNQIRNRALFKRWLEYTEDSASDSESDPAESEQETEESNAVVIDLSSDDEQDGLDGRDEEGQDLSLPANRIQLVDVKDEDGNSDSDSGEE